MPIAVSKVEELAPDQASLSAARKLLRPADWPLLASDSAGYAWGECQGSGATPYRVMICEEDTGNKCTCPSRKFPCKHSLALMWMRAEGKVTFVEAQRPSWVDEWIGRRRGPTGKPAEAAPEIPRASLARTLDESIEAPDPKAAARAQAARERNRAEREAAILAGLDDLDRWLLDQVEAGLAGFSTRAASACKTLAQRLVDAKAGGLAHRVERMATAILAMPETMHADFALGSFAEWRLLAAAYRQQADLPAPLRADLRATIGWSVTREALLADPSAPRARARWLVVAAFSEVQPDKLRRLETWLARLDDAAELRFAALIDFVPLVGGAATGVYAVGEILDAELVFYPSATPLRALIAAQQAPTMPGAVDSFAPSSALDQALAARNAALASTPWLEHWPLAAAGARVRAASGRTFVTDASGAIALPLRPREDDAETTLIGLESCYVFGLWDGRFFDLTFAETPLGRWCAP